MRDQRILSRIGVNNFSFVKISILQKIKFLARRCLFLVMKNSTDYSWCKIHCGLLDVGIKGLGCKTLARFCY